MSDKPANQHKGGSVGPTEAPKSTPEALKKSLTEADMVCQDAQAKAEAILLNIKALLKQSDDALSCGRTCSDTMNRDTAANLCEQVDAIFYSLMNDINCIAEEHNANYREVSHA